MTECGGVLIPDGTRHCFVAERGVKDRVYRNGTRRFQLTVDHYIPRSMGGADGPTHLVHHYCQNVQGGKIAGPTGGPASARVQLERGTGRYAPGMQAKGGRIAKEQRLGVHAPGMQARGGRKGGRTTKERGIAIFAPGMQAKGGRVGSCARWNIRRGKPCVCGRHEEAGAT